MIVLVPVAHKKANIVLGNNHNTNLFTPVLANAEQAYKITYFKISAILKFLLSNVQSLLITNPTAAPTIYVSLKNCV